MRTLVALVMGVVSATLFLTASAQTPAAKPPLDPGKKMLNEVKARIDTISTAELKKMIDSNQDFILLDVRMPGDIASMGSIDAKQQLEIPRGWLETRIFNTLDIAKDKDKPIVAYCGGGTRSAFATDTLNKLGFTNVRNYDAGFFEWEEKGYPTKYKK